MTVYQPIQNDFEILYYQNRMPWRSTHVFPSKEDVLKLLPGNAVQEIEVGDIDNYTIVTAKKVEVFYPIFKPFGGL